MDELATLRAENARLVVVVENLTASLASLTASLTASFTEEMARLHDRIAELTAAAQRKQHAKHQTAKASSPTAPTV